MYDTRVERLDSTECCIEVATTTTFVTHTPEDDRWEIAVRHHHTYVAVYELWTPGFRLSDTAQTTIVFPVEVTFYVGFVHTVQTVVVEEFVHAVLTRIVAATDSVHVGLLHQDHVLPDCSHIYATTVYGVCILQVSTLEIYLLAVYPHLVVLDFDVTETKVCVESIFFLAGSIVLHDLYVVQIGSFCRPQFQVCQSVKGHCLFCRLQILCHHHFYGALCYQIASG